MQAKRENGVLRMVRWNFAIPPDAAREFVADMRAYHAENNGQQRDQIAARQGYFFGKPMPAAEFEAKYGLRPELTPGVAFPSKAAGAGLASA